MAAWSHWQGATLVPTVNDVPKALGIEQVPQTCHLILELADQFVVGVLVDDGIAADLLGTVSVPGEGQGLEQQPEQGQNPSCWPSKSVADPLQQVILWRIPVLGQSFGLLSGVAGFLHSTAPARDTTEVRRACGSAWASNSLPCSCSLQGEQGHFFLPEGAEGLIVVDVSRTESSNHGSSGVASCPERYTHERDASPGAPCPILLGNHTHPHPAPPTCPHPGSPSAARSAPSLGRG